MAELTIQIPDELAQRLEPLRNHLPELLSQLLDSTSSSSASPAVPSEFRSAVTATANLQEIPQAYLEVLDFLVTRPTPQNIVAFKVSPEAQERLSSLLDKNREGILTDSEVAELDVYEQLEHLMILMKARAIASVNP
jgi:predicted DNA-binding protein